MCIRDRHNPTLIDNQNAAGNIPSLCNGGFIERFCVRAGKRPRNVHGKIVDLLHALVDPLLQKAVLHNTRGKQSHQRKGNKADGYIDDDEPPPDGGPKPADSNNSVPLPCAPAKPQISPGLFVSSLRRNAAEKSIFNFSILQSAPKLNRPYLTGHLLRG